MKLLRQIFMHCRRYVAPLPVTTSPAAGAFAVLTVEIAIDGMSRLGAAPAFVGGRADTVAR
jgi:hypothetical protein